MKISPARLAASEILLRVETEEAYASNLLASSRYDHLSREDRALAQELTLGTLRWQGQLDFLIEHFAHRKPDRMDAEVLIALRLGLYQLRFLSRIPPHAAINESVNLAKASRARSSAPMVNAILRTAQRAGASLSALIHNIADPLKKLCVETSHPAWLMQRWQPRFGEMQAREFALSHNAAPRTAFRFNDRRAAIEQTSQWLKDHRIDFGQSAIAPQAMVIASGHLSASALPVREAWLYLQDEASQLVAHLAAGRQSGRENAGWSDQAIARQHDSATPQNNTSSGRDEVIISNSELRTLLDVCAAPGSKASLLAVLAPPGSQVMACDLHLHRLQTLRRLLHQSAVDSVHLVQCDAARPLPFPEAMFDAVLLDAPCSGTGTLQRHPEIKWRSNENKIQELAALQRQLLEQAARQVRVGGLLTYAVCSTEPEEGEAIIAQFREQHTEYRDVTRERLTELGLNAEALLTPTSGGRTFTHRHSTESFFFCVLWKRK